MKILLWKIGALGDVVMTTPLLRQLRRAQPQARIDYLVGRACAIALRGHPALDQVKPFDEDILVRRKVGRLGELLPLLRGYDLVLTLDKHWVFSWLAWVSRAPVRAGFARRRGEGLPQTLRVPYGPLRHEIDYYLDLAQAAGVTVDRADRKLELPAGRPCTVPPNYTVMINSGGNNANEQSLVRRMPDDLFRGLCKARRAHAPLVFLGTPAERAYYDGFLAPGDANLCGMTDLPQAWWALERADAIFTTDTGLMHMAAAVNTNVTAVFGPTHPLRKCPPGARWVWGDKAVYDPAYEMLGTVPHGTYFKALTVEGILEGAQPVTPASALSRDLA